MAKRKNPVVLRKGPMSDNIYAITNYRMINGGKTLSVVGDGKHDVSSDYDSLVLDELLDYGADDIVAILDGVIRQQKLSADELLQVENFHERLKNLVDRHNKRVGYERN